MAFGVGPPGGGGVRLPALTKGIAPQGLRTLPRTPGGVQKGILPAPGQLQYVNRAAGTTAPHVGAPQAPAQAAGGTAPTTPPATPPSPLDAQYYQNIASNDFKVGGDINALNQEQGFANTALQSALAQLAYQQPRDQLKLEETANRQGGLYSTGYGQRLGDLNYQFLGKQGAAQDNLAKTAAKIAGQIQGLQGGQGFYDSQQYLDAVGRATQTAEKNPALGENVPATPSPATPAAAGITKGQTGDLQTIPRTGGPPNVSGGRFIVSPAIHKGQPMTTLRKGLVGRLTTRNR